MYERELMSFKETEKEYQATYIEA